MNRIFEYNPAPEGAIVSRVLIAVHKAIDEQFPGAIKASRQFTKTVFSDTSESTAADRIPGVPPPPPAAVGKNQQGQNTGIAMPGTASPALAGSFTDPSQIGDFQPASSISHHSASAIHSLPPNRRSHFGEESDIKTIRTRPVDWAMRITIVALVAGIAFLGFVLLV
jgi:hypothetical protein